MATLNTDIKFDFDNSYAERLEGFYTPWQAENAPSPKLLSLNQPLAESLGLVLTDSQAAGIFSGNILPEGASPLAQAYAGHQFGSFNPQLGDGRALLLGEIIDPNGERYDLQLKGSGRTPFSRGGDGKAALGPVLREYLVSEAMHALNIPTTRALAAVTTGEKVMRDEPLPGAILTRVATSHLRIGTFQFFSARDERDKVQQLADYAIQRHYPELTSADDRYLALLRAVRDQQAVLVAKWMQVGFVHGVMNTDNMTICGETIDYGPCAFMDTYEAGAVFSSIDRQGRYAYANQPTIAQWNLARLAETLLPLIDKDINEAIRLATEEVNAFPQRYQTHWLEGMRAKLGLSNAEDGDLELANKLFKTMDGQQVDFTLLFRRLSGASSGDTDVVRQLFNNLDGFDEWLQLWLDRLTRDPREPDARHSAMNSVNPLYIPRNHKVEEVISAAEKDGDYAPFEKMMTVLAKPFEMRADLEDYAEPAGEDFGPYKTFCGT